jgi:hypothetical protein
LRPTIRRAGLWREVLSNEIHRAIPLVACDEDVKKTADRVFLSNGTASADQADPSVRYDAGAFVPRTPWRRPSEWERRHLWKISQRRTNMNFVGIARIPDFLVDPVRTLHCSPRRATNHRRDRSATQKAVTQLVEYLCDRFRCTTNTVIHGVAVHQPGLQTVTYDRSKNSFIGLHLDSWDRLPLASRHVSLNRVCVNVGCQTRYFMFLNLPLVGIAKILAGCKSGSRRLPQTVGPAFLWHFPDYPIIRVRVDPGEAYIAPTDNLIHDATTIGATGMVHSFTVRGRFRMPGRSPRTGAITESKRYGPRDVEVACR